MPRYCCVKQCFVVPMCQVDGIACQKCYSYSYCICKCKSVNFELAKLRKHIDVLGRANEHLKEINYKVEMDTDGEQLKLKKLQNPGL